MNTNDKVLIVVDVQNDFVTGALGSDAAQAALPRIFERIQTAAENGEFVIFTQDTHGENYLETQEGKFLPIEHCIWGSEGHRLVSGLLPEIPFNYEILQKITFGALNWANIDEDVDEIELIGFCTDICVISNALILKAMFPNTKISVREKCCAGSNQEAHLAALEVMTNCHIEII